mmetsp:Transcript_80491/g.167723  ORF Transcript_80491/g.167723 Transcript_80491/m.167723 type:complete len:156 (+) Transcript_80491:3-470(+)
MGDWTPPHCITNPLSNSPTAGNTSPERKDTRILKTADWKLRTHQVAKANLAKCKPNSNKNFRLRSALTIVKGSSNADKSLLRTSYKTRKQEEEEEDGSSNSTRLVVDVVIVGTPSSRSGFGYRDGSRGRLCRLRCLNYYHEISLRRKLLQKRGLR